MSRERIVVIGAGFAGMNFIRNINFKKYEVVLVDKNNYHSFPPLFYQVASSGLDPESICFPIRREISRGKLSGCQYHMGDVKYINTERRRVVTQFESIPYDKLVIAAGSTNNFFGNPDLLKHVYTLKSTPEALRIRNEVLDRLERASNCNDSSMRRNMLNFIVVGGGPAGVEMAGAIGEMKRYILAREYPAINPDEMTITLVEGSNSVLGSMPQKCREDALRYLDELMVDVKLGVLMKSYADNIVTLSNGEQYSSSMVIWTAGVQGVTFLTEKGLLPTGPGHRLPVDNTNKLKDYDDIYAIGDVSIIIDNNTPHGHPQLAQVAIQQARNLAKNLNEGTARPFVYNDKGSMATVGRNRAVAALRGGSTLSGWFAWIVWMFIHLISILGMRNKVAVLVNWSWSYFTYATSLRLLITTARYPIQDRV